MNKKLSIDNTEAKNVRIRKFNRPKKEEYSTKDEENSVKLITALELALSKAAKEDLKI